jgi:hypothetical protein
MGDMPFMNTHSTSHEAFEVARVIMSTTNTLFLTVGATRLDNFPSRFGGRFLRKLSNRQWAAVWILLLAVDLLFAKVGGVLGSRTADALIGLVGVVIIMIGLFKTFIRYEMGKLLTAAILITLILLEVMLVYLAFFWHGESTEEVLFLTSILVTSKVAFMIVLVMIAAAWGRYYTSVTIEELKREMSPETVRQLYEVIPGGDIEYVRRKAYDTIFYHWPEAPALLEVIKTKGPSSREIIAASKNPSMVADLIKAGILNLSLSEVARGIADELMSAAARIEGSSNGQIRSHSSQV